MQHGSKTPEISVFAVSVVNSLILDFCSGLDGV
jgi:hypothetical protein